MGSVLAILIVLTAINVAIMFLKWRRRKEPSLGTVQLSPEVDPQEYSRLFAKVRTHKRAGKILIPILKAAKNNVSAREMAFLKYLAGEENKEYLLRELKQERYHSAREAAILLKQVTLLDSVASAERSQDTPARA